MPFNIREMGTSYEESFQDGGPEQVCRLRRTFRGSGYARFQ